MMWRCVSASADEYRGYCEEKQLTEGKSTEWSEVLYNNKHFARTLNSVLYGHIRSGTIWPDELELIVATYSGCVSHKRFPKTNKK